MSNIPKELWMQLVYDDDEASLDTWCEDNIHVDDVKYIRADLIEELKSVAVKAHNRDMQIDGATILFLIKEFLEDDK